MQTVYYTTTNFIRHTDNVVDLNEYRRKLSLAQEGSLAPQPRFDDLDWEMDAEDEIYETPVLREVKPRRSRARADRAVVLETCASLSVVIMTLTFAVKMMLV